MHETELRQCSLNELQQQDRQVQLGGPSHANAWMWGMWVRACWVEAKKGKAEKRGKAGRGDRGGKTGN